jgi:oligopeptide/dipeptide ABC transporter ATP-binding protein
MGQQENLVNVIGLKKYFPSGDRKVRAVDGVSFTIREGESFGLVGESGCGKTTLAKSILRLIEPTEGQVYLNNLEIVKLSPHRVRKIRKEFVFVFQNPFGSLNPVMTVRDNICRGIQIHGIATRKEATERAVKLLESLHMDQEHLRRFPHEFSGGQMQRIAIARALAVEPRFMVLDEPTSALDVSVQAQIIKLLVDIKDKKGLTYLFITHNLAVVRIFCDRIGIMYLGKLVEIDESNKLFANPFHPYTKALLSALPTITGRQEKDRIVLEGEIPDPSNPPSGCRFHTRCPEKSAICEHEDPTLIEVREGHLVACFKADSILASRGNA